MVRPLKKCKEDGTPYARSAEIEALLTHVLQADPEILLARAAVDDQNNPQYLPNEALVHLIRYALRMQDFRTANALLPRLGKRCSRMLKRKVRETNAFNAGDVREETVSQLYSKSDRQS